MNRLLQWLTPSASKPAPLERKNYLNSMIAFENGTSANWSSSDPGRLSREGFLKNPIVYRCIRMIGDAGASIPWQLVEEGEKLDQHPMLELLSKPNMRQSGSAFIEKIYGHLLVFGNAYLHVAMLDGTPRELHALAPDCVKVIAGTDGYPAAYEYQAGRTKQRFNVEDDERPILHLALANPVDEIFGHSPLAAAHMALDIHNAASTWNKSLLDNSARPSGALIYSSGAGDNLTDEQFTRLKQELEEGYGGAIRAGRPMVLEGGLDWKAMGYSPRDMDFMQAKNGASRDIALAFGIPPMLLGIPGDNTYSNYKEANRAFWTQTVLPLVKRTAASLGNWLGPQFGDNIKLEFNRETVEAIAPDMEKQWARIGSAEFLTDNEKREALGYGPIDD
ncbi:MAG: phage portal protein [Hyphomicrobiales bacterium]|nr:MAG: phage portal protein [Hyphomicrobiales bacterium]